MKIFARQPLARYDFVRFTADGRKGELAPLATLVRVPYLTDIHCIPTPRGASAH